MDAKSLEAFELGVFRMMDQVANTESSHGFWDPMLDKHLSDDTTLTIRRGDWRRLVYNEKLALIHSELSEALEVLRKDPTKVSEKIAPFSAVEDEFADIIIRVFGLAKRMGLNLGGAIVAKDRYNQSRPYMHGKKF